jgi:hypothetical protein
VRSPFGWWPDDRGHHEGPQKLFALGYTRNTPALSVVLILCSKSDWFVLSFLMIH